MSKIKRIVKLKLDADNFVDEATLLHQAFTALDATARPLGEPFTYEDMLYVIAPLSNDEYELTAWYMVDYPKLENVSE